MSRPPVGRGDSAPRLALRLSPDFTRGLLRGVSRGSSLGFTLIEVIVVIAVLSILASMAVPLAAKVIDQSRTEATRKQMEEIHKLIVGDPALGTAGFVGDMGRLPQGPRFLDQLNTQLPGQPNGFLGSLGVKMGWWGRYVNSGFDPNAYKNDAWGTPYAYGNPGAGQITSYGPDHNPLGGDDITYPPNPVIIDGKLLVNLYVWDSTATAYVPNPQPAAYPGMTATVSFYYSNNGAQVIATAATPAVPPYRFGSTGLGEVSCGVGGRPCTAGLHAVSATCTLPPRPAVAGQAVVFVPGNNQQATLNLYLR
jgi:general secretion pathway protein G